MGSFGFSWIFFASPPPPPIRLHPRRGPMETENFESPHQKFREKTLTCHVNATKSYLYFGLFDGDAILSSNCFFFSFCLFVFRCFVSFTKIKLLQLRLELNLKLCVLPIFCKLKTKNLVKCQNQPCCINMLIYYNPNKISLSMFVSLKVRHFLIPLPHIE